MPHPSGLTPAVIIVSTQVLEYILEFLVAFRDQRQQVDGMELLLAKREAAAIEQQQALDERDRETRAMDYAK